MEQLIAALGLGTLCQGLTWGECALLLQPCETPAGQNGPCCSCDPGTFCKDSSGVCVPFAPVAEIPALDDEESRYVVEQQNNPELDSLVVFSQGGLVSTFLYSDKGGAQFHHRNVNAGPFVVVSYDLNYAYEFDGRELIAVRTHLEDDSGGATRALLLRNKEDESREEEDRELAELGGDSCRSKFNTYNGCLGAAGVAKDAQVGTGSDFWDGVISFLGGIWDEVGQVQGAVETAQQSQVVASGIATAVLCKNRAQLTLDLTNGCDCQQSGVGPISCPDTFPDEPAEGECPDGKVVCDEIAGKLKCCSDCARINSYTCVLV